MTAPTETLTCEYGKGHLFTRTRTRGRKPRFCPKHLPTSKVAPAPVKATKVASASVKATIPQAAMVTLHCAIGDHDWQRPSQRGRKPLNCPDHTEVTTSVARPSATRTAARTVVPTGTGPGTVTDLAEYRAQRDAADAVREARERRAKARIDNLEIMLKASGLHLSQNPVNL